MKEILVVAVILSVFLVSYLVIQNISMLSETKIEKEPLKIEFKPKHVFYSNESRVTTISVPAVDREGNGVMASLSVEVRPGVGRTLADIDQIFFWIDTQDSIRTAKLVAENVTGIDLSNYDIVYTIQANASVIGGPSAGAATGIATISALEDREINKNVTITGTLNEEGKIGRVSAIVAKGKAAKDANMSLFLVPLGQGSETTYRTEKECENYVFTSICHTKMIPVKTDVEEEIGIEVEEVANIQEALKYFLD